MINMTIGIVGCGNMGSALARGIVSGKVASAEKVYVHDIDDDKVSALVADIKCRRGDLYQMVRGSDILILAVKPSDLASLAGKIAADITGQTLITIMAGVSIKDMTRAVGKKVAVIRAMPNMGAVIGHSMTCISGNDLVGEKEYEAAKAIFSGIGKVIEIDEARMDSVTAVAGSGPAYLFYLAEAMINAAEACGLKSDISKTLVAETLYGAALLMRGAEMSPRGLIEKVASKGGTTEAALLVFEKEDLTRTVAKAIESARKRSKELSGGE
jgi:pyrroline-5-carboxylate reductase